MKKPRTFSLAGATVSGRGAWVRRGLSGDDNLCRRFFQADLGKQGRHEKNGTVGVGEPSHMAESLEGGAKGGDVSHKGLQAFWSIFPEHVETGERVRHLFISDEADSAQYSLHKKVVVGFRYLSLAQTSYIHRHHLGEPGTDLRLFVSLFCQGSKVASEHSPKSMRKQASGRFRASSLLNILPLAYFRPLGRDVGFQKNAVFLKTLLCIGGKGIS